MKNLDRDKRALELVDLQTGDRRELFAHDRVDVGGVLLSASDCRRILTYTVLDYPEMHYFDPPIALFLSPLRAAGEG